MKQADFRPPMSPHANLGVRRQPVWLRVDLDVPATESGRWILDIDYPSLDRVEVAIVTDGHIVQTAVLGDHVPYADRPMPGRSPHTAAASGARGSATSC